MTALMHAPALAAEVVLITPDMAREWLGRNTRNRKVRARVVAAYAQDMAAGNWQLTGEAIKFAVGGEIIDGQHRLLAVVQSGSPVAMLVIRGIEGSAQSVMDTGVKRSAGDAVGLAGRDNPQALAAAAKWAVLIDENRLYADRLRQYVSHSDVLAYVDEHPELAAAVDFAQSIRKKTDLQPSLLAVAIYITARVDRDESTFFFARLADGVGLTEGSPILALRNRLRLIRQNRTRVEPPALLSITIRAWNAYRQGRTISVIPTHKGNSTIRCPEPK